MGLIQVGFLNQFMIHICVHILEETERLVFALHFVAQNNHTVLNLEIPGFEQFFECAPGLRRSPEQDIQIGQ